MLGHLASGGIGRRTVRQVATRWRSHLRFVRLIAAGIAVAIIAAVQALGISLNATINGISARSKNTRYQK